MTNDSSDVSPDLRELRELRNALVHFGWVSEQTGSSTVELWLQPSHRQQTLVPIDSSKGDFRALLQRARQALLLTEGQEATRYLASQSRVVEVGLDCTRFEKSSPLPDGLIPWDQGEALFAAAKSALVAAAKATKEPRRYHGNASWFLGRRFLESAVMGQTEVGSFVVTAYSPANEAFHLTQADADRLEEYGIPGPVSGRDVVNKLVESLGATRSALDQFRRTQRVELFDEAVASGVSHELVAALEILSQGTSESAVQVAFSSPTDLGDSVKFTFTPEDVQGLSRASSHLAVTMPPQSARIYGRVTLLERPRPGQPGIIRLDVTGGAKANKIRVPLDAEDYVAALEAHRSNLELGVSGELTREGNTFWLYRPFDFDVVIDPDDGLDV